MNKDKRKPTVGSIVKLQKESGLYGRTMEGYVFGYVILVEEYWIKIHLFNENHELPLYLSNQDHKWWVLTEQS